MSDDRGVDPPSREDLLGAGAIGLLAALGTVLGSAVLIDVVGPDRTLTTALYLLTFSVLAPAMAIVARVALRDRAQLVLSATTIAVALAAGVSGGRVLDRLDAPEWLVAVTLLTTSVLVVAAALRAALGGRFPVLELRRPPLLTAAVLIPLVGFGPSELTVPALVAAAVAAIGAALYVRPRRLRLRTAARSGRWVPLLELAVLALAGLVIFDLTGYWGPDADVNSWGIFAPPVTTPIAALHENFYLGGVLDVLEGRTLLVDANAVYGIGNTYLLAAWFELVPFGYGTFGLFGNLAVITMLFAGWAVLRLAGVPAWIAAITLLLSAVVIGLTPFAAHTEFLNVSGFRFGPPIILVLAAVFAARRTGAVCRHPLVLTVVAIAAIWSLEALVYCVGTLGVLALLEARIKPTPRAALRELGRTSAYAVAAIAVAHLLFALLTRVAGGAWPDWGLYLELVVEWAGFVEAANLPAADSWSMLWPVGALYLAAAAYAFVPSGPPTADARPRWIAVGGLAGAGASILSYHLSHPPDLYIPYMALPALLLLGLGFAEALRSAPLRWTPSLAAAAAFMVVAIGASAAPEAREKFPRTALAHLIPGGPSLLDDARRMWNSPVIDKRAPAAEQLIEDHIPGPKALVIVEPDLGQEALIRLQRANLLPVSYFWQDELPLETTLERVLEAIEQLEPGTRVLLQDPPAIGAVPSLGLVLHRTQGDIPPGERLGPLAARAKQAIEDRFELRRIAEGPDGLYIAELRPPQDS